MERSITSTRIVGTIGVIGILSQGSVNPMSFMRKGLRVQGIYVGHRNMFEDMNRTIAQHELRPVIDRTFAIEDARDEFHYMATGHHFGKFLSHFNTERVVADEMYRDYFARLTSWDAQ